MALKHDFVCLLRNGVHARPASALEEVSRGFASEVTVINQRTARMADAKSVLAIISADIRHNDACILAVKGPDEQDAMAVLSSFVDDTLPHCEDALPVEPSRNGELYLPPSLRDEDVTVYRGVPVVPGVAQGRIVLLGGFKIPEFISVDRPANNAVAEWQLLDEALQKLIAFYDRQLNTTRTRMEVELLKAHRAVARDPELRRQLHEAVMRHDRPAAGAIFDTEAHFSTILAASGSALLRERAVDIQDVCMQLFRQFYGSVAGAEEIRLTDDTIVVAQSLTPSRFLALDRRFLKGLALVHAGVTSHTVILARSFGIPTLISVHDLAGARLAGLEAVVDCDAGVLMTNLTDSVRRYYAMEQQRLVQRHQRTRQFSTSRAVTLDGQRIEIAANVVSVDEASAVFEAGAEGVGLFRTEILFLDRETVPDVSEQFEAYRRVLEVAQGRPVTIRTLDVGGDKPLSFLNLPVEENSFLGCRGVRIYPEFESLFRTQVRALLRASAYGRLKVMIPMVAAVDEVRWVKQIIRDEKVKCAAEKIKFDPALPLGAMIEVPSTAFSLDALCHELDFFSIGSNDLLQYFMAADRTNARVGRLYDPFQPAFLRLLKQIVDLIHARKKRVGLCGEIGGQLRFLPLLVGLGLDEISTSAPAIAGLKADLATLTSLDCGRLLAEAMDCATADAVAKVFEQFIARHCAPLLDPELIVIDSDAATKAEVIKQGVDRLYVLGRTENSRAVEEAVWQRELTCSTGFGHGFAIPHCKTNAVKSSSLVLLKLREPVPWNSLDGQSVHVVILLAVRETNSTTEHMKILAKLARHVMNDQFRARLEQHKDANVLYGCLRELFQTEFNSAPKAGS